MAPPPIVDELLLKVFRADKHIRDFENNWEKTKRQFINSIFFEDDEETGDRSYYLGKAVFIDDMISLIVGDAVHNLRCALDHLAQHLVCIGTNSTGHFDDICFPIGDTQKKYGKKISGIKDRLRKDAAYQINAIEPYKGGKGCELWKLHRLDIIDKHRVRLGARCANLFYSMPPSRREEIAKNFLGLPADAPIPSARYFMTSSEGDPASLKGGDKLCTVPKADVEEEMYFTFEVTFDEPEVLQCDSVAVTLHRMAALVRGIIHDFDCLGLFTRDVSGGAREHAEGQ